MRPRTSSLTRMRTHTYQVDLAEQSCGFPDDGSLLNMCSIKEGLEVLNVRQGGVCWEVGLSSCAFLVSVASCQLTAFADKQ